MFAIDDRAGNVMTTVALFAIAAAILYLGRSAFFILLLSVLFAFLLEPVVTLMQRYSWLGRKNRSWAIAEVYLVEIAALVQGAFHYRPSRRSRRRMKK
jgi:predicted PurR-regulated permease PerM